MSTKNAEVKVYINNSDVAITVCLPIDKNKMNCIQSIKSKTKNDLIVAKMIEKDDDKVEKLINNIATKWNELIEPELKKALPGIEHVKYTEANSLMKFEVGEETIEKWFELK